MSAVPGSVCAAALIAVAGSASAGGAAGGEAFFERKIRPVLVEHCYECHAAGAKKTGGKLLLDSREAVLEGGESGPALVAGKPEESLIVQALRWEDELEMPPGEPLPEAVIHDFVLWIKGGAPDPRVRVRVQGGAGPEDGGERAGAAGRPLWSFQTVTDPEPPAVEDAGWPRDPLDRFVLARLESLDHRPTGDAPPELLARRLYFDLLGLAPEIGELENFVSAYRRSGVRAVEHLVDRLLASPRFGERWGRHWLDVARYGESNGNDGLGRNPTFPHAWRYRDYVIDAFNADTPYDRFLTEQIAGDLLPASTAGERNRQLVATGFLAIGAKPAVAMNQNFAMDVVDDQIDVVGRAVMGLSVSCARCHDHKHDPITARDYYALAGIFKSTETLWGKAGNEKLTAPPTPLHALRDRFAPPGDNEAVGAGAGDPPPDFPAGYGAAIEALGPSVRASLDGEPAEGEGVVVEEGVSFPAGGFAELKEGRLRVDAPLPADAYSVAFWFRNDLGNSDRAITAYLFSHAAAGDRKQRGDNIGIGGTHDSSRTGKLYLWNGTESDESLGGSDLLREGSWNHLVLVRSGRQVRLYLNGDPKPEIEGEMAAVAPAERKVFVGARNDGFAPLKGRLAELAVFDRALDPGEAQLLHAASGQPRRPSTSRPAWAMGVRDKKKIEDCRINIGGNSKKLGQPVPRGFLPACRSASEPPAIDGDSSGRLQLAEWLTRGDHPQTARVMVNRIWLHLFGRAIVDTPDDFGVYGARPSHPELLDHLAHRFAREGDWSVKKMIRTIVLSRSYQLSSRCGDRELLRVDPDNVLIGRHSRRRLDAESVRDRILQAGGNLDLRPGAGSAVDRLDTLINWPPGEAKFLHRPSNHRSVYLCMLRNSPPPELAAFNFPDGAAVAGKRESATPPGQALFFLNSPLVVEQARALAGRLLRDPHLENDEARVRRAYRRVLQREPNWGELGRALVHVRRVGTLLELHSAEPGPRATAAWASLVQALMASSEFRYVD